MPGSSALDPLTMTKESPIKIKIPPMVLSGVLSIATVLGFMTSVFGQDEHNLNVADLLDFKQVDDAQISPNARQII